MSAALLRTSSKVSVHVPKALLITLQLRETVIMVMSSGGCCY
jgi:hypothetical protein